MLRMNGPSPGMPEPSAVARLATDAATAQKIANALAESFEQIAVSAFEETSGRWALALHFGAAPDHAAVRAVVAAAAGARAADAVVFETLAPTDWVHRSLEGLAPVAAGRFTVHGAHARGRVRANRIGIEIEAALAFGTGHHGTTRGCLLALDRIVKGRRPLEVLGVGTRPFQARGPFALVFANILLEPLRRLATPLTRLVARNGRIVLSGLLAAQANAALASYHARGLVLERRIRLDGWTTLVLVRPRRFRRLGRA